MNGAISFSHYTSLVIVTGLSGAGKSTAMDLLADSGYYVVDNLPVPLLANFISLSSGAGTRYQNSGLLLDIESRASQEQLLSLLSAPNSRPPNVKLIFLDADSRSLVRRYSETRRPHPGFDSTRDKSLEDAIQRERERLQPIKERADLVLDTSNFTVHALKRELREFLLSLGAVTTQTMRVNFLSFGFKRGVPLDCDLVVDVRFLRNPHFVESLRECDGRESAVREYVFASPDASEFVSRYADLLTFLLPKYQFEGKASVNIGVGCTGGKHRSVAIAEALRAKISSSHYLVSVKHRDI